MRRGAAGRRRRGAARRRAEGGGRAAHACRDALTAAAGDEASIGANMAAAAGGLRVGCAVGGRTRCSAETSRRPFRAVVSRTKRAPAPHSRWRKFATKVARPAATHCGAKRVRVEPRGPATRRGLSPMTLVGTREAIDPHVKARRDICCALHQLCEAPRSGAIPPVAPVRAHRHRARASRSSARSSAGRRRRRRPREGRRRSRSRAPESSSAPDRAQPAMCQAAAPHLCAGPEPTSARDPSPHLRGTRAHICAGPSQYASVSSQTGTGSTHRD
jgi:hypothetical protein